MDVKALENWSDNYNIIWANRLNITDYLCLLKGSCSRIENQNISVFILKN